jgi:hypothetical protein
METQGETEQRSQYRFTHICAIVYTITLILGLWHTAEAATSYSFIGFDAPLDGVTSTSITGVEYKSGVLVGSYTDVHGNTHGWRGNKNSATMVPLLPLNGINRQKWTVGSFRPTPLYGPPSGERQGFLQKPRALIPIIVPDCPDAVASAVNDAGEVVGACGDGTRAWHWKDGVTTVYDPWELGLWCAGHGFAATGINNAGVIVGQCTDTGFIYDHGVWTLFNGDASNPWQAYIYPNGINDKGTIFGLAYDGFGNGLLGAELAGFMLKNGVMSFVAYPGAQYTEITAVHPTNGRIWGNWWEDNGVSHAFTATPK